MRVYPAALTPDADGGFTVTFRDVPEAITEGDSREEAVLRAEDALESALAMHIAAKEPLPSPSKPEAGEVMVPLSALGMAKTAIYDAMRQQAVSRAELARRLRLAFAAGRPAPRPPARLTDGTCRRRPRRAGIAANRRCSAGRLTALGLIRPRHTEDVLADIGEDQVGRDRGGLVEADFAPLALDVVFAGEGETAIG
jgi:antitoxin HicB